MFAQKSVDDIGRDDYDAGIRSYFLTGPSVADERQFTIRVRDRKTSPIQQPFKRTVISDCKVRIEPRDQTVGGPIPIEGFGTGWLIEP